jgi:hypothetical protein
VQDNNGTPGGTALRHRPIYQEFFRYQRRHADQDQFRNRL